MPLVMAVWVRPLLLNRCGRLLVSQPGLDSRPGAEVLCESRAQRGSRGWLDSGQGPGGACTRTPCMAMAVALTQSPRPALHTSLHSNMHNNDGHVHSPACCMRPHLPIRSQLPG